MRLLFISSEYPPIGGDTGLACHAVAVSLSRASEVHVLTSSTHGLPRNEKVGGVSVWRPSMDIRRESAVSSIGAFFVFFSSTLTLGSKLCRDHAFDLIVSWSAIPSGFVGTRIARRFSIPHVAVIAGADVYGRREWCAGRGNIIRNWAIGRVLRNADHGVASSAQLARQARRLHQFTTPIEIIPNGVDPSRSIRQERPDPHRPTTPVEILSVGRLVRYKDPSILLAAIGHLRKFDIRLTMAGDGPERSCLERQSKTLGIGHLVRFAGGVDERARCRLLAASDLFVVASEREDLGLIYLEAMCHGLPVIAAKGGVHEDFLKDGETGFLVPRGDARELAIAILKLVRDRWLRQKIGWHNREIAKHLSVKESADRYEALFREMLAG